MDEQVEVFRDEVAADLDSDGDLELGRVRPGEEKRFAPLLLLNPLLLVLAGCGAGAVSAVNSAQDDGSSDSAGVVSAFEVQDPEQEPATIRFFLTDAEGDAARVSLHYQVPGEPLRMLKALGGTPNPVWLAASPGGIEHELTWTFPDEEGVPQDGGLVAGDVLVVAFVEGAIEKIVVGANAALTRLGNDPPTIEDAAPQKDEVTATAILDFTLADTSGDLVRIMVQYKIDQPGEVWEYCRPAGEDETPQFAFEGIQAPPGGVDKKFYWGTEEEEDLRTADVDVLVRFTAQDDWDPGDPTETDPFRVDNNEPPRIVIDVLGFSQGTDRRRGIPVPFQLIDPEGDEILLVFQWAPVNEEFPTLPDDPAEVAEILADPALRKEAQIASEFPVSTGGLLLPVPGDDLRVRLPDVAGEAAGLLSSGVQGLLLEVLRASEVPAPVAHSWVKNELRRPVAAVPLGDGPSALVLDAPGGGWRLSEVDLGTGELREIATGAGIPDALALEPDGLGALVASDSDPWRLERVELLTGVVTLLIAADGSTDLGPVRSVLPRGPNNALITVGNSLVLLDYADPQEPWAATVLVESARPWGLAADPRHPNRIWMSEVGLALARVPGFEGGRVVHLRLDTRTREAVVLSELAAGGLGFPRPRALAVEQGGTRILVVTDANPSDGSWELRGLELGTAQANAVFEITVLDGRAPSLATRPDGLRLLALPATGDLAVGGGVSQRRVVAAYDPVRQEATVNEPFTPPLGLGERWRVSGLPPLRGTPSGHGAAFVWDSGDVPQGGKHKLRASPYDADRGLSSGTGAKDVLPSFPGEVLELALTGEPETIQTADMDGDGDLDLITANPATNDVTILYQVSPGQFEEQLAEPLFDEALEGTFALAVADVDGNGLPDVVVGCKTSGNLGVFLQTAPMVFQPAQILGGQGGTPLVEQVVVADLDRDGDLDILSANSGGGWKTKGP